MSSKDKGARRHGGRNHDRSNARRYALMVLYGLEYGSQTAAGSVDRFFEVLADGDLDPGPPWSDPLHVPFEVQGSVQGLTADLVHGVAAHREQIDAAIQAVSKNWRLDRMSRVDRAALRIGAFELLHRSEEVPRKVAIDEAIELAKLFGTKESGAFVNGILDRIRPAVADVPGNSA